MRSQNGRRCFSGEAWHARGFGSPNKTRNLSALETMKRAAMNKAQGSCQTLDPLANFGSYGGGDCGPVASPFDVSRRPRAVRQDP